jgi:hypothetical protein
MKFDRPIRMRTEDAMKRVKAWTELPSPHEGLAASLRRAFEAPTGDQSCEFETLLKKLD